MTDASAAYEAVRAAVYEAVSDRISNAVQAWMPQSDSALDWATDDVMDVLVKHRLIPDA